MNLTILIIDVVYILLPILDFLKHGINFGIHSIASHDKFQPSKDKK